MIWLGLFLALASIPGYTSASIPAGWAALSLTLPIVAWRPGPPSWAHVAMGLFLIYVFASIGWSEEPLDGVFRLWQFCLIAGCFWLGTVQEPRPILIGLAFGYMISTLFAFGQWFGIDYVLRIDPAAYPGLHFSGVFSGAIAALLIVALINERLWFLAAACLPGLALAGSRGAILVALLGLVSIWVRSRWLLLASCAIVFACVFISPLSSDTERRLIWFASISFPSFFGHGAGSFVDLYINSTRFIQAENAHNDLLQLLFEFGIGAIPFLGVWLCLCLQPSAKHWPIIFSFTTLSVFFFPLYTPIPAAIFALCAGASVRDWSSTRDLLCRLRCFCLSRRSTPMVPVSLPTQEGLT